MSQRANIPGQVDRAAQIARSSNLPMLLTIGGLVAVIMIAMAVGINPWDTFFINPLINFLVFFNNIFFNQFGVAIILFTLLMRLTTLPLTVRQFQSTRAMQALQPKLQELQKKYKDPKRRQEETMKLYREAGVNPLGCLFPMLIQMPIWIALYRALIIIVGGTPESLLNLSQRLYPWSFLNEAVPLEHRFLWLDLGRPDATFILPLVVGITTYIQQKLTTTSTTAATPQQQQMTSMMNWMMPLMFVWITLAVPSGLGLYWVMSNIASFFISLFVYGRHFSWRQVLLPLPAVAPQRPDRVGAKQPVEATAPTLSGPEKGTDYEQRRRRRRGKRKERR
jgi:YidC/Oxa1 family membrane protein insertase